AFTKVEGLLKHQTSAPNATASVYLQLGELYLSMKQYDAAEKHFNKAMELDAASPMPHADLGVLSTRKEMFKDAIQHFEDAAQRDPYSFVHRTNLAEAYYKMNLNEKAETEYKRILGITENHVESHIGLGEVYKIMGDNGDVDMYDLAVSHFTKALKIGQSRTGSKTLKKKELAPVYYSIGYSRVKLYETAKLAKDEGLLHQALADFKACFRNDSEHYKARRAAQKIEKRISGVSPQRLADRLGPLMIGVLSFPIFLGGAGNLLASFLANVLAKLPGIPPPAPAKEIGNYVLMTFGALIFMVAGLYLPQILKLSVGGIQLEKGSAEQVTKPTSLGISK